MEYIEEIAQELVDEALAEGYDELASALMLVLGDFGIFVDIPQGETDEDITH